MIELLPNYMRIVESKVRMRASSHTNHLARQFFLMEECHLGR